MRSICLWKTIIFFFYSIDLNCYCVIAQTDILCHALAHAIFSRLNRFLFVSLQVLFEVRLGCYMLINDLIIFAHLLIMSSEGGDVLVNLILLRMNDICYLDIGANIVRVT